MAFPAFLVLVVSLFLMIGSHGGPGMIVGAVAFALAALYLMALSLVHLAMRSIFQAAMYLYAKTGTAPLGFIETVMQGAIRAK